MRQRFQRPVLASEVAVVEEARFLDPFFDIDGPSTLYQFEDESLTVANLPNDETDTGLKIADLEYEITLEPGETVGGVLGFEVWTGAGRTGTQFTVLKGQAAFGSDASLEARYTPRTGRIEFKTAQLTTNSVTALYVSGLSAKSWEPASKRAALFATTLDARDMAHGFRSYTAVGSVAVGFGYLDSDWNLRQLPDLRNIGKLNAAVWILEAKSHGESVKTAIRGTVDLSALSLDPPAGQPIYIGNNALPTWPIDTSGNKIVPSSGDIAKYAGMMVGSQLLELNLNRELGPYI